MCIEFMDLMPSERVEQIKQSTKWIHTLRPSMDGHEDSHQAGEWTGRMAVIRNIVNSSGSKVENRISTLEKRMEKLASAIEKLPHLIKGQ